MPTASSSCPYHLGPSVGSLSAQAADMEFNLLPEADRLFVQGPPAGSLFYHEPQKARLASFDAKSPFGQASTYTWLVSQMSPSGSRNRRRFVHSLATLDAQQMFDGGWLLSLGQEDALRDIVSVYRQLPAERFETVPGEFQPVTMRSLSRGNQTYVYLVNDSPWNDHCDAPGRRARLQNGKARRQPRRRAACATGSDATWSVTLRPYDLAGAGFSTSTFRVHEPHVTIADQVRTGLERRIKDLGDRVPR